jgi:hypothetical protein
VVDAADAVAVAAGAAVMVAAAVVDATNGLTTFATDSRGFSRINNRKATILVVAFFRAVELRKSPFKPKAGLNGRRVVKFDLKIPTSGKGGQKWAPAISASEIRQFLQPFGD